MSFKGNTGTGAAVLAAAFSLGLFCSGCGDVFRPVANPVFQPGGDPQRIRHAVVISSNGANTGAAVVIDVSGDDVADIYSGVNASGQNTGLGRNPVYAINLGGTDYVVNKDDHNVSVFAPPAAGGQLNAPSLATLPAGANPVFAAAAQGKLFVADSGTNGVAVISGSNFLPPEILVGGSPVAVVATPDGTKVYVVTADGKVRVILPATNQMVESPIPIGAGPVWATVSTDGSRVFVVNQGDIPGTVSVIDTTTGPTQDTEIARLSVGAHPNYIVYDATLNRAYVTNDGDNSLSIIENATATPPTLPTVVPPVSLSAGACAGKNPVSITALAAGGRVYVAAKDTSTVCVLDTTSNQFIRSITKLTSASVAGLPLPAAPVFIASDSDSFRVYTANSGSFDISIIDTATDATVKQSDGTTPLTICAGPPTLDTIGNVTCLPSKGAPGFVPTFIAMTP